MRLRDILITTGGIISVRLILTNFSKNYEKELYLDEEIQENTNKSILSTKKAIKVIQDEQFFVPEVKTPYRDLFRNTMNKRSIILSDEHFPQLADLFNFIRKDIKYLFYLTDLKTWNVPQVSFES